MDTPKFRIEFAQYPDHLPDLRAVREPVFIIEQAVPPELEWDELDPVSIHVVARTPDGSAIGVGRLTPQHGIGRMAVLAAWRKQGVGGALLTALLSKARELGYPAVELHAQTHAISFYEDYGFIAFGPEYDEAGIPHRSMRLVLPTGPVDEPAEDALRETDSPSELAELTLAVIQGGRRELVIYTRDLDPVQLGRSGALDALRRFVIATRDAKIRILTHDLRRAIQEDHGLIALTQRLSSHVSIRVIEQEPDVQYASAFILNDRGGYVFRPIATRSEATACMRNRSRQRQLLRYFNEVWERSRPATELRPLT